LKRSLLAILIGTLLSTFTYGKYPRDWWKFIPPNGAPNWEILPQEAADGEVILSKRTELGIFSNLAKSPFTLDGESYESIEGLWQGMKYPDANLKDDPRLKIEFPYTRKEVYGLSGWPSKEAGNMANDILDENDIDWINYKDHKFNYVDYAQGSEFHLELITRAIRAKVFQNPKIKNLLKKTKGLVLKPDHHMSDEVPESFKYHQILMSIRDSEL
tara:strand:- start:93753 stop:94397 length:645 start_codon:yes stop_codon:yes gene_type:complete